MCQLVSWIEKDKKLYYLTHDLIWNTKRGKEYLDYLGNSPYALGDLPGHGAIRWYFELEGGTEKEVNDFSKPKNFPDEIVGAIKGGEFRGLGTPEGLLKQSAREEYQKIRQSAYEEYQKIRQLAREEYEKIEQPAYAEYQKIRQSAYEEYQKIRQSAFWDLFADTKNRVKAWS